MAISQQLLLTWKRQESQYNKECNITCQATSASTDALITAVGTGTPMDPSPMISKQFNQWDSVR